MPTARRVHAEAAKQTAPGSPRWAPLRHGPHLAKHLPMIENFLPLHHNVIFFTSPAP